LNWMQTLCNLYDNCEDIVGQSFDDNTPVLPPIYHTLLKSHITIVLNEEGDLVDAYIQEDKLGTMAPGTEASLGRTSSPQPHLLVDSLKYVAGDLSRYIKEDYSNCFKMYLEQLEDWCSSQYTNKKVQAVLTYIKRGEMISNLVTKKLLFLGDDDRLMEKWTGEKTEKPQIFSITTNGEMAKLYVRFCVRINGALEDKVWCMPDVWESAQSYIESMNKSKGICYVTGEVLPIMRNHPKKITSKEANAKLVSAQKDGTGNFKYSGRFLDAEQALNISATASLKAHYALTWLMQSRGINCGSQTIVCYGAEGQKLPDPTMDEDIYDYDDGESSADISQIVDEITLRSYAKHLNSAIRGYSPKRLEAETPTIVMALDNATPGRLSITFYQYLLYGEYLERIAHWHNSCCWLQEGFFKAGKPHSYVRAPLNKDIIDVIYGKNAGDAVKKNAYLALMSCVFSGNPVPREFVHLAIHKASAPLTLGDTEKQSLVMWKKAMFVACALYKKQHEKEELLVSLDLENRNRSYLFGRLLAVADKIEKEAMKNKKDGSDRATNALRYMTVFSQRPVRTWKLINDQLNPYKMQLDQKVDQDKKIPNYKTLVYYEKILNEIFDKFEFSDFDPKNDKALDGMYLLGFHSQNADFYKSDKNKNTDTSNDKGEN